jgi:uncharacterized protein YndB with AHSA1/START domain
MSEGQFREIRIERFLPTRPGAVFSALTDATQVAAWWGPEGWTVPKAEIDPRQGGAFNVFMKGPGLPETLMRGTLLEFESNRHLRIETRADAADGEPGVISTASMDIDPHDDGSRIRLTVKAVGLSASAAPMLAGMRAGWNQSLQKLEDVLTGRADRQLVFQALVPAAPDQVWGAWSDIKALERWWGPNGFTITNESFVFSEGGEWRFTMHGPDGSDYPQRLLYSELLFSERIRYRHLSAGFDSTITFDEMSGQTALTMRLAFESSAKLAENVSLYHADEGGTQTLARLCSLFPAGPS